MRAHWIMTVISQIFVFEVSSQHTVSDDGGSLRSLELTLSSLSIFFTRQWSTLFIIFFNFGKNKNYYI